MERIETMTSETKTMEINGVTYRKVEPTGKRAVFVLTSGWIYAGDYEEQDDKHGRHRVYLTRAVLVRHWSSIGFTGMLENPSSDKVTLEQSPDIDFPIDVEIFRAPVSNDWGVK